VRFDCVGGEQLTVPTTRAGGLSSLPAEATHAIIAFSSAGIRWFADGQVPTTTVGIPQAAGGYLEWMEPSVIYRSLLTDIRFISTGAGAAILDIQYFRVYEN
jgi:hypothetical protein